MVVPVVPRGDGDVGSGTDGGDGGDGGSAGCCRCGVTAVSVVPVVMVLDEGSGAPERGRFRVISRVSDGKVSVVK